MFFFFFFQAEDGIRDADVTGVQTCALPILRANSFAAPRGVRTRPTRSPRSPCDDRTMTATSAAVRVYAIGAVKIAPRGSSLVTYENGEMSTGFAANPNGAYARSPVAGFRTLNSTG